MDSSSQRLGLRNTFVCLTRDKRLKVIVIGNSVTYGAPDGHEKNRSFYVVLGDWLRSRFPDAKIEIVTRIIFAIGPEVQVFRMDERVIAEKPDLVLTEFTAANGAANTGWGKEGPPLTEAATEGFIRRLRLLLPQTDCLMQMAIYQSMMDDYRLGHPPLSSSFHHKLAPYYNCVYADAAAETARQIIAGEKWETFMDDGIHPSAKGYGIYGDVLVKELEHQWSLFHALPEAERVAKPHAFPEASLTSEPWLFPRLVPAPWFAKFDNGFTVKECGNMKYIAASRAGASGSYRAPASGKIVGVMFRNSKPCGNLEVQVGDRWIRLSQREPRFNEEGDNANMCYRRFFAPSDMPAELENINFRVSGDPEEAGAFIVEIIGFFVIERPAAISFERREDVNGCKRSLG